MKFSLEIEGGNAAFEEDHGFPEVARILREAADRVANGNVRQNLRDYNGNTVGEYVMEVDEPEDEAVECPQCDGEDKFCSLCGGSGSVSESQAAEWHRQNDETEEGAE